MKEGAIRRGGRRIATHDPVEGLAALAQIEASLGALPGDRSAERVFRNVGDWLLSEAVLRERLCPATFGREAAPESAIPGLPLLGPVSTLRRILVGERFRGRSSASAIFFRSNLRAFYPGRKPLTLWIARRSQPAKALARAMENRARFATRPGLRTTQVIAQQLEAEPFYILEEMVSGRPFGRPEDFDALADTLLPELFGFYDQGGLRHCRAAEVYGAAEIEGNVREVIRDLEWQPAWVSQERFLDAVSSCLGLGPETLPLCIGHGDLTTSNFMIAADGGIVVLDWEDSREMPIADDLVKLVRQHPPLVEHAAAELRKRTEDPAAMPPGRQLLLAMLAQIARLANPGPHDPWARVQTRRARKASSWLSLATRLTGGLDG